MLSNFTDRLRTVFLQNCDAERENMCVYVRVLIYNGKYTSSFVRFPLPARLGWLPVSWIDKTDHWVLGQDRGKPIETNQLAGSGPNVNQTATSWTNTRYSEYVQETCHLSLFHRSILKGSYWGRGFVRWKIKIILFLPWTKLPMQVMWNDELFIYCSFAFRCWSRLFVF